MSQCPPKVTHAAHCSATTWFGGLQTAFDGTMVPPRKVPARPKRLGKIAAGGLRLTGFERQSARHSGPEGRPDTLRLTVGSMKISRTALIALATAALLGPWCCDRVRPNTAGPASAGSEATTGQCEGRGLQPDMTNKERVVAKVNGHGITVKEVQLAADDIPLQLPDVPANLRYPFLVEYLIEQHLLAQAAVNDGLGRKRGVQASARVLSGEGAARRLFYREAQAGGNRWRSRRPMIAGGQDQAGEAGAARHIFVGTEKDAEAVLARLDKGEKFEDVAMQVSVSTAPKDYRRRPRSSVAAMMVSSSRRLHFALKPGKCRRLVQERIMDGISSSWRFPGGAGPSHSSR